MIKARSQIDKRIDDLGGGGFGEIYEGEGIKIDSPDGTNPRISIREASATEFGGVKIITSNDANTGITDENVTDGDVEPYIDHCLSLKWANSRQKGGLTLGDGLTPTDFYFADDIWGMRSSKVKVRLGGGLTFADNPSGAIDQQTKGENGFGGRPITIATGTGLDIDDKGNLCLKLANGFTVNEDGSISAIDLTAGDGIEIGGGKVAVKIGAGLEFTSNGALVSKAGKSYVAGNGIEITEDDESENHLVAAKIGEGLDFDKEGALIGLPNIENAVIIQEADAKYLLHEYTQTEYIAGNKIGYGGPSNPIILQGLTCYANGVAAPNGIKVDEYSGKTVDEFPDIPVYGSMLFQEMGILKSSPVHYCAGFHVELEELGTTYNKYRLGFKTADEDGGVSTTSWGQTFTVYNNECGVTFVWNKIYPPGTYETSTLSKYFPYGYAVGRIFYKRRNSSTNETYSSEIGENDCALPFASEAEYNAAVMLTNESLSLIQVNETTTEV